MTAAQTLIKEGELIGMQLGRKEGRKEGMQLGKKEGRQLGEYNKGLEIAKNMLLKGMEIPLIEDVTGLSTQEIMQLSDKLGLSNN